MRLFVVITAIVFCACRRPVTDSRAPGQPTMNELMHQNAEKRKAGLEEYRARAARINSLTPADVAKMEANLRSKPDDLSLREDVFSYYLNKQAWSKLTPHMLWAIQHEKYEPGQRMMLISHVPDPAVNREGYETGKQAWLKKMATTDDATYRIGIRYLQAGDKRLAEKLILEKQAANPGQKDWTHALAGLYFEVLVGSQGPLPLGVVRSVSLTEAHGSHAQSIRRTLEQTRDADLLFFTGQRLINSEHLYQYQKAIDFDVAELGRHYLERGIALQPDSRMGKAARVILDRSAAQARLTKIISRGQKPEEALAKTSEEDRYYLLPVLISGSFFREEADAAKRYNNEYLSIAKRHPEYPLRSQALFDANMNAGKLALRRGDRATAARYLLASLETTGSPRLQQFQLDMSLARSLVDWGEREGVAKFLDRCATLAEPGERYKAWAADIRRGLNPDLIPYRTGCRKEPC